MKDILHYKEILALLIIGTLMYVFYTSHDITAILVSGSILFLLLLWSMKAIYKSNIDTHVKRCSLITIIVLISIITRMYDQIM